MSNNNNIKNIFSKVSHAVKKHFSGITLKRAVLLVSIEAAIIAAVIALDLLTKKYIYGNLAANNSVFTIIEGVLVLFPTENTGASFGIFKNATAMLTVISSVTIVIVTAFLVITVKIRNPFLRSGLVLIIAGGAGNLIDRLALGYVRDFIYFELIDFAIFNVADSSLTIGVICILIFVIFFYKPEKPAEKAGDNGKSGGGAV